MSFYSKNFHIDHNPSNQLSIDEICIQFQSLHSFFLRTVPSYADEVRPLVEIVKNFKWTKVILISSNEEDYRKFFIQFTSLAYDNSITVSLLTDFHIVLVVCRTLIDM